jgi:hypothetical protein
VLGALGKCEGEACTLHGAPDEDRIRASRRRAISIGLRSVGWAIVATLVIGIAAGIRVA